MTIAPLAPDPVQFATAPGCWRLAFVRRLTPAELERGCVHPTGRITIDIIVLDALRRLIGFHALHERWPRYTQFHGLRLVAIYAANGVADFLLCFEIRL